MYCGLRVGISSFSRVSVLQQALKKDVNVNLRMIGVTATQSNDISDALS